MLLCHWEGTCWLAKRVLGNRSRELEHDVSRLSELRQTRKRRGLRSGCIRIETVRGFRNAYASVFAEATPDRSLRFRLRQGFGGQVGDTVARRPYCGRDGALAPSATASVAWGRRSGRGIPKRLRFAAFRGRRGTASLPSRRLRSDPSQPVFIVPVEQAEDPHFHHQQV
jgi:hypothetical protein